MNALRGLAILLVLQAAGEALAHALALPFPGPVLGMLLILPLLQIEGLRRPVQAAAQMLLDHLSLLFVPVGVGVITHWDLVSTYGLRLLLTITRTPYPTYFAGAQFVHVLLGPAMVALAWPFWLRLREIRRRAGALLAAALLGGVTASASAVALGWAFGIPGEVIRSLASKSVTAPVAMGIAERVGGVPALAAVSRS